MRLLGGLFGSESRAAKKKRLSVLGSLFDFQMRALIGAGCPRQQREFLRKQKDKVVARAIKTEIVEGRLPFVPVVPSHQVGVSNLLLMVRNDLKLGRASINFSKTANIIKTPKKPYFIFNVDIGGMTLGKTPRCAEQVIQACRRSGLTFEEVIALYIQTKETLKWSLEAVGSRYGSSDSDFSLYLLVDSERKKVPELSWGDMNVSHSYCAAPSCKFRKRFK